MPKKKREQELIKKHQRVHPLMQKITIKELESIFLQKGIPEANNAKTIKS